MPRRVFQKASPESGFDLDDEDLSPPSIWDEIAEDAENDAGESFAWTPDPEDLEPPGPIEPGGGETYGEHSDDNPRLSGLGGISGSEYLRHEARNWKSLISAVEVIVTLGERLRAQYAQSKLRCHAISYQLAIDEISEILWSDGIFLSPDRLHLFFSQRVSPGRHAPALARAEMATQVLARIDHPLRNPTVLEAEAREGGHRVLSGDNVLSLIHEARQLDCHPITRQAFLMRQLTEDPATPDGQGLIERSAQASLLHGYDLAPLPFIPLAIGGHQRLSMLGRPLPQDLGRFFEAVQRAGQAALGYIHALDRWQERFASHHRRPSKTLAALRDKLLEDPVIRADCLERAGGRGASSAHVRRLLHDLERAGLVREVTGDRSFRYWSIALSGFRGKHARKPPSSDKE